MNEFMKFHLTMIFVVFNFPLFGYTTINDVTRPITEDMKLIGENDVYIR